MSFDLVLHAKPGRPPLTRDEVDQALSCAMLCMEKTELEQSVEYIYNNPETRVYFLLYFDPNPESDEELPFEGPLLAANINYARPTFFAIETIPIVIDVARRLSLTIFNPQDERETDNEDELTDSWKVGNQFAVSAFNARAVEFAGASDGAPTYCPADQLMAWWKPTCAAGQISRDRSAVRTYSCLSRCYGGTASPPR